MISQFAQVNDIGTVLIVQMVRQSDGLPLDISGASSVQIIIGYPDGNRTVLDASLYTNGLDGKMYVVADDHLLTIDGDYFIQGKAVVGDSTIFSSVDNFTVKRNVPPPTDVPAPDPHVGTFTNADLVAGVLTLTHDEGLAAPYTIQVTIFNNLGHLVTPDSVVGHTNTVDIDLNTFSPISGTWGYAYT